MMPSAQTRQDLTQAGTLLYAQEQLPLQESEWDILESLLDEVSYDHVVSGDASEDHSVYVARFVNDVERPVDLNALTDKVKQIVLSEKMLKFYSTFTGTDVLCLRRCQANMLLPGDYIGLHKDQDSNPDYIATVVFHFDERYQGGEFVTYHPEQGAQHFHPVARSVLVNNCEIPHEVTPLTKGKRKTLACFLSLDFGESPTRRQSFRLSN